MPRPEKVRYLKALGAHDWNLSAVSLAKQQAYARQVQARRPVKTRDIKPSRQLIELVCFLRVTLLELTDVALLRSSRRSQQLFREAADKAQSNRAAGHDQPRPSSCQGASCPPRRNQDLASPRHRGQGTPLAELAETAGGSFVSQVRKALAEDSQRVHACLAALKDLDFGGGSGDPGFEQWKAWAELQRQGSDRDQGRRPAALTWVQPGMAWCETSTHARVPGLRGLHDDVAAQEPASRQRWLDHSLSFRERDQMLIPPAQWAVQRDEQVELLRDAHVGGRVPGALAGQPRGRHLRRGRGAATRQDRDRADGMLHLPAITALADQSEPVRTRETIYKFIGSVQFPDLLLEVDAATGYSEVAAGPPRAFPGELVAL